MPSTFLRLGSCSPPAPCCRCLLFVFFDEPSTACFAAVTCGPSRVTRHATLFGAVLAEPTERARRDQPYVRDSHAEVTHCWGCHLQREGALENALLLRPQQQRRRRSHASAACVRSRHTARHGLARTSPQLSPSHSPISRPLASRPLPPTCRAAALARLLAAPRLRCFPARVPCAPYRREHTSLAGANAQVGVRAG